MHTSISAHSKPLYLLDVFKLKEFRIYQSEKYGHSSGTGFLSGQATYEILIFGSRLLWVDAVTVFF